MKMKVRYLITKKGRDGPRHFWQPSKVLRDLGWRTHRLADDLTTAIVDAEKLNAEVDAWRKTGGGARAVDTVPMGSVAWVIRRYLQSPRFARLAERTQREYRYNLKTIEAWAGDAPVRSLSRKLVQRYYTTMMETTPAKANAVLRVLRILLKFAWDEGEVDRNVAERPGMIGTAPRLRIWSAEEIQALIEAAESEGRPSIGDAVMMGAYLGQRQGDLLKVTWLQYQDGVVRLRQGKGSAHIAVPAVPVLRDRLEAAKARLQARGIAAPTILVSESTNAPYKADNFRHVFTGIRERAASIQQQRFVDANPMATAREIEGAATIRTAWFLDLRDTAVTRLAEAGCTVPEVASITGHELRSVHSVLRHYLALNGDMAASAIAKLLDHEAKRLAVPEQAAN